MRYEDYYKIILATTLLNSKKNNLNGVSMSDEVGFENDEQEEKKGMSTNKKFLIFLVVGLAIVGGWDQYKKGKLNNNNVPEQTSAISQPSNNTATTTNSTQAKQDTTAQYQSNNQPKQDNYNNIVNTDAINNTNNQAKKKEESSYGYSKSELKSIKRKIASSFKNREVTFQRNQHNTALVAKIGDYNYKIGDDFEADELHNIYINNIYLECDKESLPFVSFEMSDKKTRQLLHKERIKFLKNRSLNIGLDYLELINSKTMSENIYASGDYILPSFRLVNIKELNNDYLRFSFSCNSKLTVLDFRENETIK